MALRFPRFSQGLAQDPTTRRIWFGIATAHDFESHDDITEECLYQNIFASHFGQLAIIFLWTFGNLFHVAWQGNFESWVQDPLHVRPIAHAIWDPHFGQPAVEAFTRGGALGPVNIAYSGVYQWWLVTPTTEMETERFLVQKCQIWSESSFVRTLRPKFLILDKRKTCLKINPIHASSVLASFFAEPETWWGYVKDLVHALGRLSYSIYFLWRNGIPGPLISSSCSLAVAFSLEGRWIRSKAIYPTQNEGASRDYNPEQNEDNVLARMLDHKEAIISHLSWASLFLGFHTLGLYVHNDVMLAFGTPEKQILIEPIFAQWIQSAHGKTSYGFDVLLSSTSGPAFNAGRSIWLPGWLNAVNENSNSLFLTIGPGDFLVHHAIALGLHTTTLILVKGALDARGSKLMPDKKDFG
ncbi:Photosystem I chlorophyll a apoprotein A2 [Capsicum annuum]|uniref:Photosystem I chlorophyll a apoprotein A2 n=1 Tax=Capsicum annuum TaxID=4072 RepID=A0A2G2XVJ3_CAPAN|nr:Photosystem I chlorophyll a apoprotein A2 [Capsicum annuum]